MSEYSGRTVDLEVARYGLRTFRAAPKSHLWMDVLMASVWALFGIETAPTPDDPLTLFSVSMLGDHWSDGTCEARCVDHGHVLTDTVIAKMAGAVPLTHEAPFEGCGCGIYATLSLEHLNKQYGNHAKDIVAVIAAEGQTLIGDQGFRTQYARVVAYWCTDKIAPAAKRQFRDAQRYLMMGSMLRDYGIHNHDPVRFAETA